jgi:hypothetical protein
MPTSFFAETFCCSIYRDKFEEGYLQKNAKLNTNILTE